MTKNSTASPLLFQFKLSQLRKSITKKNIPFLIIQEVPLRDGTSEWEVAFETNLKQQGNCANKVVYIKHIIHGI